MRERVAAARLIQRERFLRDEASTPYNATLTQADLDRIGAPSEEGRRLLRCAVEQLGLSARAYMKLLRVARTIADLAGRDGVDADHVAEAIQSRCLDHRSRDAFARAS